MFSDECYAEYTWDGPPRTILGHGAGPDGLDGVIAVHSLSKRSNLAGLRIGWYAGDPDLVRLPAGGAQARRLHGARPGAAGRRGCPVGPRNTWKPSGSMRAGRLRFMADVLAGVGAAPQLPGGGFYLWVPAPAEQEGDEWAFTEWLASSGGVLVSPGSFYGAAGAGY